MSRTGQGSRRFTIADGMILVAATAAGLAWIGRVLPTMTGNWPQAGSSFDRAWMLAVGGTALALPCVLAWTVAVLVLRLRGPRPSWRRIVRQPGAVACLAASLGLLAASVLMASVIAYLWMSGRWSGASWKDLAGTLLEWEGLASPFVGVGVAISWAMLAIEGRWRSERGWIDRAGRALGLFWIITIPLFGGTFLAQYL